MKKRGFSAISLLLSDVMSTDSSMSGRRGHKTEKMKIFNSTSIFARKIAIRKERKAAVFP